MAMIAKTLLLLIAPILTYTADELVEYAPLCITNGAKNIFDMNYEPLPSVVSALDESYMMDVRSKFFEVVDELKKEGTIKNTLEVVIYTNAQKVLDLPSTEAEDWFLVSKVIDHKEEALKTFEHDGSTFMIIKASKAKCPRCWKYQSDSEECPCPRCEKALG
jgi:isoleucyl-tRNA synthetase